MYDVAASIYVDLLRAALPFAIVFGVCDLIVGTFLRVAFGGRLKLSGGGK